MILLFVLNPGLELGGTSSSGIDPTTITAEALKDLPLSKYEIVILYDVSSLAEKTMSDLATFVSDGGSLLIVCSGKTDAPKFNGSLAAITGNRPTLAPAGLGNDIEMDQKNPAAISLKDMTHPILSAFADARRGDLSVIRFEKIRTLQPLVEKRSDSPSARPIACGDTRVIIQTTTGCRNWSWNGQWGRGRVMMFCLRS